MIEVGREAFMNGIKHLERVYYGAIYRATKTALQPVVAAYTDVLQETVADAVRKGVKDALSPTDLFGEFFAKRKNRWTT